MLIFHKICFSKVLIIIINFSIFPVYSTTNCQWSTYKCCCESCYLFAFQINAIRLSQYQLYSLENTYKCDIASLSFKRRLYTYASCLFKAFKSCTAYPSSRWRQRLTQADVKLRERRSSVRRLLCLQCYVIHRSSPKACLFCLVCFCVFAVCWFSCTKETAVILLSSNEQIVLNLICVTLCILLRALIFKTLHRRFLHVYRKQSIMECKFFP